MGFGAFCGLRGPVDACYVGFRGFQGWVVFRALRLWWVRVLKIPGVLGSWGCKSCMGRVLGPGPGQGPGAGAKAARDPNPGPIPGLSSSLVPGNSRAYMPPTPPHTPRFTPFGPLQPSAHQRPVPLNGGGRAGRARWGAGGRARGSRAGRACAKGRGGGAGGPRALRDRGGGPGGPGPAPRALREGEGGGRARPPDPRTLRLRRQHVRCVWGGAAFGRRPPRLVSPIGAGSAGSVRSGGAVLAIPCCKI